MQLKITIERDEATFDEAASQRIIAQIRQKPDSVIGLSTGRTTGAMHRLTVKHYQESTFDTNASASPNTSASPNASASPNTSASPFDTSRVTFFGLDEVMNVPRDYFGACYTMLKTEIIDGLGIADDRFLMLPTESTDWPAACHRFVGQIEARGGIDLLMLGLGENGHLGFNQPGTPFESRCWTTRMNPELEARIRRETQTPPERPLGGATLGIADIMHARRIVLVAKGANKAGIVRQMLCGPITTDVPASVLQLHPYCEFLLDSAAASELPITR